MEYKIIVIDISFDENGRLSDKLSEVLKELQIELFRNGYRWIKNGKEVQNFYSSRGYLVLIDKDMYTMTEDGIRYMKKDNHIHFAGTALSYFRYLKLKKLKVI
jgi:hypothetical protein